MTEYVDIHCHWIPGVDDGARNLSETIELLTELGQVGFGHVIATPHMRPGLFDNDAPGLRAAFQETVARLQGTNGLPDTGLSAEHYFDDIVFGRLRSGNALPYPGARAALLEFYEIDFPYTVDRRLAQLKREGLLPVIAHPERYRPIWRSADVLERLVDVGAAPLLDIAALVGKYGRRVARSAEELLERGLYQAACSDAHRPEDVRQVAAGIDWLAREYGDDELRALLVEGPAAILRGERPG